MWQASFGRPDRETNPTLYFTEIVMESFFALSLLFNFFVELKIDGQVQAIRDFDIIAIKYIQGYFVFDLIPCIPFQFIDLDGEEKLFYLLKIMRLYVGIQAFDISAIISFVGNYNTKIRIKNIIENNP